jgi:luciferase family oxidoreductase group 1
VLAAAVAAATSRIRVGTGGVMLPNHRPIVVAEQFGVLESLFPGRIDMGLGRSVGFTDGVRRALGRDKDAMEDFGAMLAELLGYFTGGGAVRAWPATGLRVPAFVLATGAGADVAAERGLPLVIGAVRGEERMLEAIGRYRTGFRPSAWAAQPYVVVSAAVAVAETGEQARAAGPGGVGGGLVTDARDVPAADPGRGDRFAGHDAAGADVLRGGAAGSPPRDGERGGEGADGAGGAQWSR